MPDKKGLRITPVPTKLRKQGLDGILLVEITTGFCTTNPHVDAGKIYALILPYDVSMTLWCGHTSASPSTHTSHLKNCTATQHVYRTNVMPMVMNGEPITYKVVAVGNTIVEWANNQIDNVGHIVGNFLGHNRPPHLPTGADERIFTVPSCPLKCVTIGGGHIPHAMQRLGLTGVYILETPDHATTHSVTVPPGFPIITWCGLMYNVMSSANHHTNCITCQPTRFRENARRNIDSRNYTAVGYGQQYAGFCNSVLAEARFVQVGNVHRNRALRHVQAPKVTPPREDMTRDERETAFCGYVENAFKSIISKWSLEKQAAHMFNYAFAEDNPRPNRADYGTDEEFEAAAEAHIKEFVENTPQGARAGAQLLIVFDRAIKRRDRHLVRAAAAAAEHEAAAATEPGGRTVGHLVPPSGESERSKRKRTQALSSAAANIAATS